MIAVDLFVLSKLKTIFSCYLLLSSSNPWVSWEHIYYNLALYQKRKYVDFIFKEFQLFWDMSSLLPWNIQLISHTCLELYQILLEQRGSEAPTLWNQECKGSSNYHWSELSTGRWIDACVNHNSQNPSK